MTQGRPPPLESARPSIEIGGQRDAMLSASLLSMNIFDGSDGLMRCELRFGNWGGPEPGFQHFGRDRLEFGKSVAVRLDDALLFDGRIGALQAHYPAGGTPQFAVSAEDRLQDLRMTRRTRCFEDATLADVAQRIASDHGLQPELSLDGASYKILAQVNQSDLAFLRDIARREDAQIWVEGGTLKGMARPRRAASPLRLAWAGTLREFHVCADLAHQRTSLVAGGWSVADKSAATHEADEAAIRAELQGGDSGVATLNQAFGGRTDTLAHGLAFDASEARALAEASLRHLARRFVVGRGVAITQAGLRAGAKVDLAGLGALFDGEYTLIQVHHRFDAVAGLRSEFECDRPDIGKAN